MKKFCDPAFSWGPPHLEENDSPQIQVVHTKMYWNENEIYTNYIANEIFDLFPKIFLIWDIAW